MYFPACCARLFAAPVRPQPSKVNHPLLAQYEEDDAISTTNSTNGISVVVVSLPDEVRSADDCADFLGRLVSAAGGHGPLDPGLASSALSR